MPEKGRTNPFATSMYSYRHVESCATVNTSLFELPTQVQGKFPAEELADRTELAILESKAARVKVTVSPTKKLSPWQIVISIPVCAPGTEAVNLRELQEIRGTPVEVTILDEMGVPSLPMCSRRTELGAMPISETEMPFLVGTYMR
jgi:hypothetical protein